MENDIFVNLQILSFLYTYLNIHKPVWSLVIIGIFRCYLVLYTYVFFISHHTRTEEMHFLNKVGVVSGYCLLWVVVFVFIVTFSNFSVISWLPEGWMES